jgi:thiamine biosynthesis lipoprotein
MSPDVQVRHFAALGSTCELMAVGASPAALERCQALVMDADARLTRFVRDSELSQLNAASGRPVPASPLLYGMLEAGLHAYEISGGLVNIAVLPALCAAGYDRPFRLGLSEPSTLTPPVTPPLPDVLWLDPGTRTVAVAPGAALDLGGIAKGALADLLIGELGDNAVCNLGGDLRVRGGGPRGDGWHVGLCDGSAVALTDGGIATSGTTRRRWGKGMHHLLDPRTGLPVYTDLTEVSVVTDTALHAEVYAKTAVLMGSANGLPFISQRADHFAVIAPAVPATVA